MFVAATPTFFCFLLLSEWIKDFLVKLFEVPKFRSRRSSSSSEGLVEKKTWLLMQRHRLLLFFLSHFLINIGWMDANTVRNKTFIWCMFKVRKKKNTLLVSVSDWKSHFSVWFSNIYLKLEISIFFPPTVRHWRNLFWKISPRLLMPSAVWAICPRWTFNSVKPRSLVQFPVPIGSFLLAWDS